MIALLIDLGWKSALIAALALLASHALLRRAAGERVILLRVAVCGLLMLPVFALAVPALEIAILPALNAVPATAVVPSYSGNIGMSATPASAYSPRDLGIALYGIGVAFVLFRLLAGLLTLRRWTRAAAPVADPHWIAAAARVAATVRRPVRLLVSPHVAAPLSWGIAPAWILIGPASERHVDQADAVIAHEMAHIRRLDWPMLVASRLAMAIFWFNPLVWLVDRELARQAELRADEDAVGHVAQADYAQTLLTVAGLAAHPVACGMAAPGTVLARRIGRVLDDRARPPASRLFCAALLVCGPCVAAPLAAMKLVPAPTPKIENVRPAMPVPNALPVIIPAARAAERPMTVRPRRASTPTAKLVVPPVPTLAEPPSSPALLGSPSHVAASSDAERASQDAVVATRRAERVARKIVIDGKRDRAMRLSDAANDMRANARTLEKAAGREKLPQFDQEAHMREARSLRMQAEQLDAKARRLIFEP